jgi:hypothetical protein
VIAAASPTGRDRFMDGEFSKRTSGSSGVRGLAFRLPERVWRRMRSDIAGPVLLPSSWLSRKLPSRSGFDIPWARNLGKSFPPVQGPGTLLASRSIR